MARHRSPNYPAIGLSEALGELQKIWKSAQRASVGIDVLGKAMGYSSLSGPVRTKVAALRKYGLLEQAGGDYKVSELALNILLGEADSEERKRAIAIAASRPESFRELYDTHANVSDDALRSYLMLKKKFTELGAKQFIRAFRDTLSIADPTKASYSGAEDVEVPEAMSSSGAQEQTKAPQPQGTVVNSINAWTWTLSMPRNVRAELKIAGEVTRADIERLKKQIALLEESFEEETEQ